MSVKIAQETEQRALEEQIERQKTILHATPLPQRVIPYPYFVKSEEVTLSLHTPPKVGALLLAGGVGSRLRSLHPKGCFPIEGTKSLYHIAAEKVKKEGTLLVIMTSEVTDQETQAFFKEHRYFGLSPTQVDFFVQKSWPLLDQKEEPFLEAPGVIAMGPNGNGAALSLFTRSPFFEKWKRAGIEHISLFPVDNPLAEPFFLPWITHHVRREAEITLLVTKKRSPEEKMGIVALVNDKLGVVEYNELSHSNREQFFYGNTGMMLFSMNFAERIKEVELPLHVARKSSKKFTQLEGSTEIIAYKFEQFIFDLLFYSNRSEALVCDREQFFAPLKDLDGDDGVESVRKAMRGKKLL